MTDYRRAGQQSAAPHLRRNSSPIASSDSFLHLSTPDDDYIATICFVVTDYRRKLIVIAGLTRNLPKAV